MDVPQVPGPRRQPPPGPAARRGGCGGARPARRPRPAPARAGARPSGKGSLMTNADSLLARMGTPADLKALSDRELAQLADEMRAELIGVVGRRSAHFASNLGVVELCLALHLTFDFRQDRLI